MSTSGDAKRLPSATVPVSIRSLIDARRRLDELGTARLIGEAAEIVHKAQTQGQPLGKLSPDAIVVRSGKVALDLPPAPSTGYSAPERLRGASGDRRSDVFALGVILWEALAHVKLFEGDTDDAIKAAVLGGEIHPVSELNANVPAELDAICKKALSRDPADRYQSAKVMAAEISAVLDDAGYPEGNEDITRWIAAEFPEGPPRPAANLPPAYRGTETVMGMAPIKVEDARAAAKVLPPILPASSIAPAPTSTVEARAAAPTAPPAIKPTLAEKLASTKTDKKATQPAATKPPAAKPVEPAVAKPVEPAARPVEPAATKPAVDDRTMPLTPIDIEVVPLDTKKADVVPLEIRRDPTKPPSEVYTTLVDSKPLAMAAAPTTTLTGMSSAALLPAILTAPPTIAPTAPAPTAPTTIPGAAIAPAGSLASHPGMKLPDVPPGATINAVPLPAPPVAAPPAPDFTKTSILGSPNSPPAPVAYQGARTEILGSNAIIEATNAAVSAANPPPPKPELPVPFSARQVIKPSISNAETVATPAVAHTAPAPSTAQAHSVSAINPSDATAMRALPPPADDDFASSPSHPAHPAAVVSLPRTRAPSRGDKSTAKGDVLAGWGWGTGAHEAYIDDEGYEDETKSNRKRLVMAIGGAVAAALIVTIVAFAFSGGDTKKDEVAAKKPTTGEGLIAAPPTPPPPAEPPKPEPVVTPPAIPPPAAVEPPVPVEPVVEPPKPEPEPPQKGATEPVVEPPKPEPVKPEPPKVAKIEPPKKVEPPKKITKKPEPKKRPDVALKKPDKKPPAKPVDPYAPAALKLDAAAAYKNGLQQFARGDSGGALTTFKASLATDPGFAPTWRGIGLVYEKLGKKSQAMTAFKRYLQLSPNAGDAEQIRNRLEKLGS